MNSSRNILYENDSFLKSNNEKHNNNNNHNNTPLIHRTNNNHININSENQNKISNNKYSDNKNSSKSKSVYSPFVIKKTTENIETNLQGLNLNTNFNTISQNKFLPNTSNKNITNNFFDKNTFSPESQNTYNNNKFYTPSPIITRNNVKCSDRFVPMNKGLNLLEKFELTNVNKLNENSDMELTESEKNEDFITDNRNFKYDKLIKKAVFGCDYSSTYDNDNDNNYINKNLENPLLKGYGKKGMDIDNCYDINNKNNCKAKILEYRNESKKKTYKDSFDKIFDSMQIQGFNSGNKFCNDINMNMNNNNNTRKFNSKPYKIVNAPKLLDDFYLNLLDWSSKNDIAVGLDNSLCLYNTSKSQMSTLFTYEEDQKYVSSLIWNSDGTDIAVGNSDGIVEIWDGKLFYFIIIFHII
jgi:WD40 repeat protein